jgi:hypothetical protein
MVKHTSQARTIAPLDQDYFEINDYTAGDGTYRFFVQCFSKDDPTIGKTAIVVTDLSPEHNYSKVYGLLLNSLPDGWVPTVQWWYPVEGDEF